MKDPQSVHDEIVLLLTKIGVLEKKNARLLVALKFYSRLGVVSPEIDNEIHEDSGDIARAALAELEKKP